MKFYAHGPLFAGVLATAGGRSAGVSPADAAERAKGPPPGPLEVLPDREPDPSTGRHQEAAVLHMDQPPPVTLRAARCALLAPRGRITAKIDETQRDVVARVAAPRRRKQ